MWHLRTRPRTAYHDIANSGDARRDATAPGAPEEVELGAGRLLSFLQPGDDLLCGRASAYEVRTSGKPITAAGFDEARPVTVEAEPTDAGTPITLALPKRELRRHVAVRAVDEQGNVGRPGSIVP